MTFISEIVKIGLLTAVSLSHCRELVQLKEESETGTFQKCTIDDIITNKITRKTIPQFVTRGYVVKMGQLPPETFRRSPFNYQSFSQYPN